MLFSHFLHFPQSVLILRNVIGLSRNSTNSHSLSPSLEENFHYIKITIWEEEKERPSFRTSFPFSPFPSARRELANGEGEMHHREGRVGLNRIVPVNKYPIKRRSKVASHALKYYFSDSRRKT